MPLAVLAFSLGVVWKVQTVLGVISSGHGLPGLEGREKLNQLRATESHPTTTRGQEMFSSVVPSVGQKAKRFSPVIFTTASGLLCYCVQGGADVVKQNPAEQKCQD